MKTFRPLMIFLLMLGLISFAACSDSTTPETPDGVLGNAHLEGNLDPEAGTFVLKTIDLTNPEGPPVRVQLIGSEMVTNPDLESVELMVSLRNLHNAPLYAPAMITLKEFQPEGVMVLNADFMLPIYGPGGNPIGGDVYGFDYSDLLGEDGELEPGETSEGKLWRFYSPQLGSFAFGAEGEFGLAPNLARLGGICFNDDNQNGLMDADESPLPLGAVSIETPGGDHLEAWVQESGRWSVHVFEPGLYTVHFDPLVDTFAPVAFSTPNPLQVILTSNPDGTLQGFLDANFGMYTDLEPGYPLIQFSDEPADSLHFELWDLQGAHIVDGHFLQMEVGFSGCQPDHPFSLYMTGGFMESNPVQVNLVPVHDLAEDCDAYFTDTKVFNLWPLREQFLDYYGPGVLLLNIVEFDGDVTSVLEWHIFPED